MKKVLIALDYNPTAQKVAEVGHELAKKLGAVSILLHVISDPVYYTSTEYSPIMGFSGYMEMGPLKLNNAEELKKTCQEFLDSSRKHLGEKSIQTLVMDGDYAEAILKAAKDVKADIIVMGSHSRKWLEKIVMGSVTEKVLDHTTIPIFIVPTKKMS